jgi:hypothetical protein
LLAVFLRHFCRSAVLLLSLGASSSAFAACPEGQTEICVGPCFCSSTKEGFGALYESVNQMAASGLENWIVQSRNTLAAGNVQPIPLHVRAQLEPYYDLRVLESVRYKAGDDGELNAASAVMQNPDVNAVTLMDIIVFRNPDDALNNVALWAHELKHVQQYLEWGTRGFAERYTRDYSAVESPAYQIQAQVARELRAQARASASAAPAP